MKIIFLNIWQGKAGKLLKDYLIDKSRDTDILCLLEVSPDYYEILKSWFPKHHSFYKEGRVFVLDGKIYGQVIFVKNTIKFEEKGKVRLYNQLSNDIGFLQYALLNNNGQRVWIGNVHGKTNPGDKKDTKIRLKQSEKIVEFFKDKKHPIIIGGDFNLLPDTKSIKILEEGGYKNLIKDFKVKSTRNNISWNQFKDKPGFIKQYFADYVFTSLGVKVKRFEVPYVEISDHLPLILDFEA